MRYLFYATSREMPEEIKSLLTTKLTPEVGRWMSWADQLAAKFREEGLKEGQAQRQRLLERLSVQLKYGHVPDEVVESIERASGERLDELSERLPGSDTLEELLR